MAAEELDSRGWHLTGDSVTELYNDEEGNIDKIIKKILDIDLKDIGEAWLNEDVNMGKVGYVKGPGVLQIQKLRNVSSPKTDEDESQAIPDVCLLSLTDGHVTCSAVTLEPIKGLCLKTPPGSKVLLSGAVEVNANFLLLSNKNTRLLGGWVDSLAKRQELKKTPATDSEAKTDVSDEKRPPPFVPFEQKITSDMLLSIKNDNFKSLNKNKVKKASQEDTEFQQHRQAALKEAYDARIAKQSRRTYGGDQFLINNRDVAKILEMGFCPEEAVSALKRSNGHMSQAINILISERQRYQRVGHGGKPEFTTPPFSAPNYYSIKGPQGFRSPIHGVPQALSSSPDKYGRGSYEGSNCNQLRQQWLDAPSGGGRDNSFASESTVSSGQYQTSLKENSQKQEDGVTQKLPESNQKDTPQLEREQNNCSDKHNEKKNISDKHNTDHQEGPDNHNGSAQNLKDLDVQINSIEFNNDDQKKTIEPSEGAYRSSLTDQVAINRQQNYHGSYDSKSGPHQPFKSQTDRRSYREHVPVGAHHHQPSQEGYFQPTLGRQGYNPKQLNVESYPHWNNGDICLARYWRDQQFYPAVVNASNGRFVMVTFIGYGDVAEVNIKDTQPIPHQPQPIPHQQMYQGPHSPYGMHGVYPPPYGLKSFPGASPYIQSADFNTGGGYHSNNYHGERKWHKQLRPTQEYYQPPKH